MLTQRPPVWRSRILLSVQTVIRYLLAFSMMPYGISKLANLQFQVSAWDYTRPLGEINGTTLTWAFLGYSPWFQFLLGVLETVPMLLLLFRRTWRLGALLMFPMALNVALTNYAMNLWQDTKKISLELLVLDLMLLAWCVPMFWSFLQTLLTRSKPIPSRRWRIVSNVAEIAVPAVVLSAFCFWFSGLISKTMPFDFIGNRQINHAGTWSLEHMTVSGQDVPSVSEGLVYFDFQGRCFYVKGSQTLRGKYRSDRFQHTFQISDVALDGDPATFSGTYRVQGSQLLLSGERHNKSFQIMLQRSNWGPQLPLDPSNSKPMPPSK